MEKRLFIGIKIEPSDKLLGIYEEIKLNLEPEKIKWITKENMHITLKFLGNTDIKLITQIKEVIKNSITHYKPFQLELKGIDCFTKNKQIKVIWMGIDTNSEINALANHLINKMENLGFENEQRDFKAHLTLGRVNSNINEEKIQRIMSYYQDEIIQKVIVSEMILFESLSSQQGPKYIPIEKFHL